MRTGQNINNGIRPEFQGGLHFSTGDRVGSIDAPELICAGGFERTEALTIKAFFPLPLVILRESA